MPIDVEQLPSPHSDKRARPSYEVRLDVTGTPGVPGDLDVAATVFLPQDIHDGLPLLVAFPGGGYSRRYYAIEKVPGYSQAAYHTSQGAVFVAIDHLGVGESSQPDPFSLSFENLAAANHLAVVHLRTGLQDGSLLHGLTFVPGAVIGIGQSMGACLLTVQQANHRTFDAVAFLGWSAIFTTFPSPEGGRLIFPNPKRGTDLRQFTGLADAPTPDEFRFGFHWPDEPPELIEADLRSMNAEDAQQMAGIGGPSMGESYDATGRDLHGHRGSGGFGSGRHRRARAHRGRGTRFRRGSLVRADGISQLEGHHTGSHSQNGAYAQLRPN
jgi:hypothetical protein